METCDGLVVEELTLDQWLMSAFIAARHAVPKATVGVAQAAPRPQPTPSRIVGGARTLYWVWLAGALLAFTLY
jgi:hypothetical protein